MTDLADFAEAYAEGGYAIIPVTRNKVPLTKHGITDATTDLDLVRAWWRRYPNANIAGRVPAGVFILDIDPRKPGAVDVLDEHQRAHGEIFTRTVWSGRGDGGHHLFFKHPGGTLKMPRAYREIGWDLKKGNSLTILPPSIHGTGNPYYWDESWAPIAVAPAWLVDILTPAPAQPIRERPAVRRGSGHVDRLLGGDSIADWYTDHHTWAQVLEPHRWWLKAGDGEADGSVWMHPAATSACSATIRHGCLFVYTTSTDFEPTEEGDPNGYTRFAAYAELDHGGDLSAAARAAREIKGRT